MTMTAVDHAPQDAAARARRTRRLAIAHAVLAVLILAGFVFAQMHRG